MKNLEVFMGPRRGIVFAGGLWKIGWRF